jgi:Holliday junction DNA helicase RuvA
VEITPGQIHLAIDGGVVFKIFYPVSNYTKLSGMSEPFLYTVMKIKDEDVILYGFISQRERILFEKLIAVSGIGGKTALSLVSAFSVTELISAIDNGDIVKISSIPGIGKKTAQRVILELTGKLELDEGQKDESVQLREDLVSALVNLGYPQRQVKELVNRTLRDSGSEGTFEELFKLLLKNISRR